MTLTAEVTTAVFENTLKSNETTRAALIDLDAHTRLLLTDKDILRYLRRKKEDVHERYQWPIVTAISKPGTKPISRLWLGLKSNALPTPILRGYVRDVASYVVGHAFPKSGRGWRVVSILEGCAKVSRISTLDKLREAEELCGEMMESAHTRAHAAVAESLRGAVMADPREGAIHMCAHAIEGRSALHAPNQGAVLVVLSKILSRLCEKALKQHPQGDVLRRTI